MVNLSDLGLDDGSPPVIKQESKPIRCRFCGLPAEIGDECSNCHKIEESSSTMWTKITHVEQSQLRYPGAAICSFLFVGLGQMVKGEYAKAICFLVFAIIGYLAFFIPGLIVHIWAVVDAYVTQPKK